MLGGKWLQRAVGFAIELDEHVVPDFEHIRIAAVHKMRGVAATDAIEVNLTARSARTRLAHLPKVVLHVARNHMTFRQQ